ncbi:MAG: response regulator, partial [Acidimicrobiia bacterium]|nr:response regulator [Acidimicrobiia bacterium]
RGGRAVTRRAIVVDDDPAIVEELVETIESMGHSCAAAGCMESARLQLKAASFDYLLLDLEIPVGSKSKFPRFDNGKNLLREIRNNARYGGMRIIVITGHWKDEPYAGLDVIQLGADGYVVKPFGVHGRTIDDEVRRVLGEPEATARSDTSQLHPFVGGVLVFSEAAVTLNRVAIAGRRGGSLSRKILDDLNAPASPGAKHAWRGSSGAAIAERIGAADQNAVASAVKKLRNKITRVMAQEADREVALEDVIENRGQGYRLTNQITLDQPGGPVPAPAMQVHEPASDHDEPANGQGHDPATERRAWVVTELKCGRNLRRADLMSKFGVSESTAKRDLRALIQGGDVEFIGATKTGHYQLASDEGET